MEHEMSTQAPYKMWTIVALKNECKQRGFSPKEFTNVTDKAVLVKLLEMDDKKGIDAETSLPSKKESKKVSSKKVSSKKEIEPEDDELEDLDDELEPDDELEDELDDELEEDDELDDELDDEPVSKKKPIKKEKPAPVVKKKDPPAPVVKKKNQPKENPAEKAMRETKEILNKKSAPEKKEKVVDPNAPKKKLYGDIVSIKKSDGGVKEYKPFHASSVKLNEKLKKAGLWISGCQFLTAAEKEQLYAGKNNPKEVKKVHDIVAAKLNKVAKASLENSKDKAKFMGGRFKDGIKPKQTPEAKKEVKPVSKPAAKKIIKPATPIVKKTGVKKLVSKKK